MKFFKVIATLPLIGLLGACEKTDKTVDQFFDSKELTELQAGIWVDPNGCEHWIIDDGVEGYLSARLDRKGKPVCSGTVAPPTIATGPFKDGSPFPDPI